MASISSLTGSSSATSIYGSRNVISGLASGLDTETLIENAVSGFKSKISGLQQQQQLVQWKQDAYRGIIDKMVQLNRKYTSYTSSTNLFSQSFFNKAVTTSALGASASAVSASGRTNSSVKINSIKSLAQAAQYRSSASGSSLLNAAMGSVARNAEGAEVLRTESVGSLADLDGTVKIGSLSGGMSIKYGASSVYVSFDENDVYDSAEALAEGIREKLGDSMVKTGSGEYVKASDRIDVQVDEKTGEITFADKSTAKNAVYINSVDKELGAKLGISRTGDDVKGFSVGKEPKLTEEKNTFEYLSGKSLSVTLNGSTKSISLKDLEDNYKSLRQTEYDAALNRAYEDLGIDEDERDSATDEQKAEAKKTAEAAVEAREKELRKTAFETTVQNGLDKAFGKGNVTVNVVDAEDKDGNAIRKLGFDVKNGATLSVTSDASTALGLGDDGLTSYLNTSMKLSDFLDFADKTDKDGQVVMDSEGNVVKEPKKLTVNGVDFEFDGDTTIESLMNTINSNREAGVSISYSRLTNQFSITATETGTSGQIDIRGELSGLFGATATDDKTGEISLDIRMDDVTDGEGNIIAAKNFTAGTDAVLEVEINGQPMTLTRSSNAVDFDGMSVTLKKTFDSAADGQEPITFESRADTDKIIDAIQSFVNDYNEMVTEIRKQYATVPAEKSSKNHTRYMPLTDEDRESMSDSAIAAYEEKAKQGILFGQSDLANLHSALRDAISFSGKTSDSRDALTLSKMGISTSYSNGLTTLEVDVDKLRETLESDPDSVRDIFTRSTENGAKSDGVMQNIKRVIDTYANTSTGSRGILIERAGSQYAPTSLNSNALQTEYDNLTAQIEKWQDKMTDRVDYYTKQFTALEQLMSQMNNQSSMLSSLMGGDY